MNKSATTKSPFGDSSSVSPFDGMKRNNAKVAVTAKKVDKTAPGMGNPFVGVAVRPAFPS